MNTFGTEKRLCPYCKDTISISLDICTYIARTKCPTCGKVIIVPVIMVGDEEGKRYRKTGELTTVDHWEDACRGLLILQERNHLENKIERALAILGNHPENNENAENRRLRIMKILEDDFIPDRAPVEEALPI